MAKKIPSPAGKRAPAGTPQSTDDADTVRTSLPVGDRPVIYDEVDAVFRDVAHPDGPITYDEMRGILGHETESEYTARQVAAGVPEAKAKFRDDWVLGTNRDGQRVVCWHNVGNRRFRPKVARSYGQDMLNRVWAGPQNYPSGTVNGEACVIGCTGRVISLQHRGMGFLDAVERWRKESAWATKWPTEPVFECLLVVGVSEQDEIVQTVDNVEARSEADVIETGYWFAGLKSYDRQECSRMLARAVAFLWERTRAGEVRDAGTGRMKKSGAHGYRTRSEMAGFIRGHEAKLRAAITHIRSQNLDYVDLKKSPKLKPRAISDLNLSPGECAGMLFLMGCSGTSEEVASEYLDRDPRTDKKLDWGNWETAKQFWVAVALGAAEVAPLRAKLVELANGEEGVEPARAVHKHQVLARAWLAYLDAGVTPEALEIDYQQNSKGIHLLADETNFGGIDIGPNLSKLKVPEDDGADASHDNGEGEDPDVVAAVELEKKKTVADKIAASRLFLGQAQAPSRAGTPVQGQPQRVQVEGPSSVAEPGSPSGKPPDRKAIPRPAKAPTRKETEVAQTKRARQADAAKDAGTAVPRKKSTPATGGTPRAPRKKSATK